MTKERRLKQEARESATWRGHNLSRFNQDGIAKCLNPGCTAHAMIDPNPASNGIDIHGRAVAMHCPVTEEA